MVGMCRLCASLRKEDVLEIITEANHEICRQLRMCFQIEISMEDSMPKKVCKECVDLMHIVYGFYRKVREAQESLAAVFPSSRPREVNAERKLYDDKREPFILSEALTVSPVELFRNLSTQKEDKNDFEDHDNSEGSNNSMEYEIELEQDEKSEKDFVVVYEDIHIGGACEPKSKLHVQPANPIPKSIVVDEEAFEEVEVFEAGEKSDSKNKAVIDEDILMKWREDDEPIQEEYLEEFKEDENPSPELQVYSWQKFSWGCYLCSYTTNTFPSLFNHLQECHNSSNFEDIMYKCTDCQKICGNYHALINHVRFRHHSALVVRCDICDAHCGDVKQFVEHRMNLCMGNANYPEIVMCDECGKAYSTNAALRSHVRGLHSETSRSYECSQCNKKYKRRNALRVHQRVHSGESKFSCQLCSRTFRQKVNLDNHVLSHATAKAFECKVCKKKYKTSVNLEKHSFVHMNIKDFQCDFCEKAFRTRDGKLSHERTHTGVKPYECEYCARKFRYRSTLLSHVNTHTGQRPYSCSDCNHFFTNWSNYNKHMKRRHSPDAKGKVTKSRIGLSRKSQPDSKKTSSSRRNVVSYTVCDNGAMVQLANKSEICYKVAKSDYAQDADSDSVEVNDAYVHSN